MRRNYHDGLGLNVYLGVAIVIFVLLAILGSLNISKNKGENVVNTYNCDYKTLSLLRTSIDTVDQNGNTTNISGNILKLIEDPLTMKDSDGTIIGYAGDAYNLINQDDHGIYINGDFQFDMVGDFSVFGNRYYLRDAANQTIATIEFNFLDTEGVMYDANGVLIAQYVSNYIHKDYTLYIYDTNTIDERALLMVFASYVSDKEADNN